MRTHLATLAFSLAFSVALSLCGLGACNNGGTGDMADMSVGPVQDLLPAPLSACGKPGDKGNSIGVGKFCTQISDCTTEGAKTTLCSSLGNGSMPSANDTYFCTIFPCKQDGGADFCGDNATCVCGSGGGMTGCACTPNTCLDPGDMR